jgi:broad specificity phosphatase PhoE
MSKPMVYVVVARHGERWDYSQRDIGKGKEWIESVERPWDPPLSPHGLNQAARLGEHICEKLQELGLPRIAEVYSSPLLRCRQTACKAADVLNSKTDKDSHMKVRVEFGLTESLNQSWYRSWALLHLSDTTWGFVPPGPKRELDEYEPHELHPSSQIPAEQLLDWKSVLTHSISDDDLASNAKLLDLQDMDYVSSTRIEKKFALKPTCLLESKREQEDRMYSVLKDKVEHCIKEGLTRTLLMVSHGGPVTHLYSKLTGYGWHCHGESKYCSYTIYQFDSGNLVGGTPLCTTLLVNESKYLDDLWLDSPANI